MIEKSEFKKERLKGAVKLQRKKEKHASFSSHLTLSGLEAEPS